MNRSPRTWIEGDVHEVMWKLMYEAGPVAVNALPGPVMDEQHAGPVQRILGKLKKLMGH